jgi:hypothetical protein
MSEITYKEVVVEAIFQGVYIKVTAEGRPHDIIEDMRESDPDVKFKDSFPVYGRGGGNSRETKEAKVLTISIRSNNGSKYIDLGCLCEDGDQSISVSKKKVDDFLSGAKEKLENSQAAELDNSSALVIIRDESKLIPIKYFEIEGKRYFDSFGG